MNKHDPEWITTTAWGSQFDPSQLIKTAIKHLIRSNFQVELYPNTETGYKRWAIVTESDPTFWIDSFRTKKEAVALCKEMEWEVLE